MKTIKQYLFIILLIMPLTGFAEQSPIKALKDFLAMSKTITADFKQVSFDESGKPAQTSYGLFYLQRPGKFRWDYKKPFEQQIISNANKVWFYDVDLEQVTIKKLDKSVGSTPALLLSGQIEIEDNFTIKQQGKDEGLEWVKLSPKDENSGFKYILIGMDNGELGGMELSDNFGQLTRIYFSKLKTNQAIDKKMFEFKAPEGVDVFSE